jgi:uroporphyrinogen-III synthase
MSEVKILRGKDILIFRGKGGRETLKEGLEQKLYSTALLLIKISTS